MKYIIKSISNALFYGALAVTGFCAGMSVKVFMERGVPVVHGGGELLMLFAIPASIAIGYRFGYSKNKRK